jgi:hypothetical protein
MTNSKVLGRMLYRCLAIIVIAGSLIALPDARSSSQSNCCDTCLKRFLQCDGTTIVCCKLYDTCVQQCPTVCPECPDR